MLFPFRSACLLAGLFMTAAADAQPLEFRFESNSAAPVRDVVVTAGEQIAPVSDVSAVMDQQDKEFRPYVLAVNAGTGIAFPNSDQIRHHVYSFSSAKRFEIRLYHGEPGEKFEFDEPGIAVLGCNIHDNMVGYIYITEHESFGVSGPDGTVQLDVSTQVNRVTVWHPSLSFDASRRLDLALDKLARDGNVYVVNLGIDTPPVNPQGIDPSATDRFQQFLPGQ